MVKGQGKKTEQVLKLGIGIMVILLFNLWGGRYFFRVDLTQEKRYTLSSATKSMLKGLTDQVYVEVYLAGELPADFKRLQKATVEMLEEFSIYAGNRIQYRLQDPNAAEEGQAQQAFYQRLVQLGIQPNNLTDVNQGAVQERLVFPGVVMSYGGKEQGAMLLKGDRGASREQLINQSIESLEFELALTIRQLSQTDRKRVALVYGQGELDSLERQGVLGALLPYYDVEAVNLPERGSLEGFDAAIVARPTQRYTEANKYKLDQFIMQGGRVLFSLDGMQLNLDSLARGGSMALPYERNLRDLLFRYGVRINNDFIQDRNSGSYPIVVGQMGNQPQVRMLPWPYFARINHYAAHPVVRNLDAVYMRFASTLDTVKAAGITKTPVMFTSPYTRIVNGPVRIAFDDLKDLKPELFNRGSMPVGYVLEGPFTSLYKNLPLPQGASRGTFKEQGVPNRLMVVADGDLLRPEVNRRSGQVLPLGVNPMAGQGEPSKYANDDLVVNAMAWLLNEGIIEARNRQVQIRPLDPVKKAQRGTLWVLVCLGGPLVLLVLYGLLRYVLRKRKYASFTYEQEQK